MDRRELTIISKSTPFLCTCSDGIQFNINSYYISDSFPDKKTDGGFLLCVILDGFCTIDMGGKEYQLSNEHFVTISDEFNFTLSSVSGSFLCFVLNIEAKFEAGLKNDFCTIVLSKLQGGNIYLINDNIKSIISILKSDALLSKHDSESLTQIYLDTLLSEITRVIAGEHAETAKNVDYGDARIDAAINYINENISANITASDVAKYVFLSEKQLKRIFINTIGKSPTDYIKFCRYERARKLLKESEFSIYEIAELAGFKDIKSFVEFFKRYSGQSPAKYRKMENK